MSQADKKMSIKLCEFKISTMKTCTDLFEARHQSFSVRK